MQLNYVRDELTSALLSYSKAGRNQIVAMAERAAPNTRFTTRAMREVEINNTVILIEAETVHCTEGRRYKTSTIPVSPMIFSQVAWRQATHRLPPQYRAWLNYCYGDSVEFQHQEILTAHIWFCLGVYQAENKMPAMSSKTQRNLRALAWLAAQEAKNFINRGEYKYSPSELSSLCGVTWENWRKNYQTRWDVIQHCCAQLDREALINVSQLRKTALSDRR